MCSYTEHILEEFAFEEGVQKYFRCPKLLLAVPLALVFSGWVGVASRLASMGKKSFRLGQSRST